MKNEKLYYVVTLIIPKAKLKIPEDFKPLFGLNYRLDTDYLFHKINKCMKEVIKIKIETAKIIKRSDILLMRNSDSISSIKRKVPKAIEWD